VAPIAQAPWPTAIKALENTWNALDMGGLNIKNIPSSSGLFSFPFLINLYLNHNSLSAYLQILIISSFGHSPLQDQPMLAVVRTAAECIFVPLTIGGGIKDTVDPDGTKRSALEVAGAYFRAGADKVSIGSEAVYAVERLRQSGKLDGTT
jgi:hypothetical protein